MDFTATEGHIDPHSLIHLYQIKPENLEHAEESLKIYLE